MINAKAEAWKLKSFIYYIEEISHMSEPDWKGVDCSDKTRKGCEVKSGKCTYLEARGEHEPVRLGVGWRQEMRSLLKLWVDESQEESTTHPWRQEGKRQGIWWEGWPSSSLSWVQKIKSWAVWNWQSRLLKWSGRNGGHTCLLPSEKPKPNRKGK